MTRTSLVALALIGSACAHGPSLRARVRELTSLTQDARDQGAYRCAPEELARAEAELEFASRELSFGDRARAEEHLLRASANARAALRLSRDPSCRDPSSSAPQARLERTGCAAWISLTQPWLRRGSSNEHAAI